MMTPSNGPLYSQARHDAAGIDVAVLKVLLDDKAYLGAKGSIKRISSGRFEVTIFQTSSRSTPS